MEASLRLALGRQKDAFVGYTMASCMSKHNQDVTNSSSDDPCVEALQCPQLIGFALNGIV